MLTSEVDRDALARRFEAWVDEALGREAPPEGIAAEILEAVSTAASQPGVGPMAGPRGRYDLYSMWAAMTALTQEVKLQSRGFRQLNETLAPVAGLAPRVDSLLSIHSDSLDELRRQAETSAQAEIVDALIDMRDRLARGLESARKFRELLPVPPQRSALGTLFSKMFQRPPEAGECERHATAALEQGYGLSLERLNDILDRLHIGEIPCLNREFDANIMSAVDTEETRLVPEGTVLEVYRSGYEWNGEVYRTAQVKVAKSPKTAMEAPHKTEGK